MPGPVRSAGSPSQRGSAFFDQRIIDLIARVELLEQQLGGKRIVGGSFLIEWKVKGLVSEQKAVATGLTTVTALGAQLVAGSAGFVLGVVGIVAGTPTWEVRSLIGEIAAGATTSVFWIALGE